MLRSIVWILAALSLTVDLAAAGNAECTAACVRTRKSCLALTKSDKTAMRSDCKDLGGQKSCFKEVASRTRAELVDCREANGQCLKCCGGGGAPVACSTGCDGEPLPSTWAGIQKLFKNRGCTDATCHGAAKSGGLDLASNAAYKNLIEVPSTASALSRIEPGDAYRSYLFLKLAARTDPSLVPAGVEVGTPMPNGGLPALTTDELEAVRKWIYAGAPEAGNVPGTGELLGACLPPARPFRIRPLAAPAPADGFQFKLPPFRLKAHSEVEYCFATYYDLTSVVPKEFQDPTGTTFYQDGSELRQDPQSHHLILNRYFGADADVHDPAFGKWTCVGGKKTGVECEPTNLTGCGKDGVCTSEIKPTFACIGYGPTNGGAGRTLIPIGGAQKAQSYGRFAEGVYAGLPMKGILYWNPHAFNLTDNDTVLHGWLNYHYAADRQYFVRSMFNIRKIFSANAAPFTKQDVCNTQELPKGARVYQLSSHTHRHGEYFWIKGPDDTLLYENLVYNDPPLKTFDPPLAFDSDDPAQRTLTYCATFNNGLREDGSFDTELVTRASRVPPAAPVGKCKPVACVAGQVGAACTVNADCDSTPGAGDGNCDACNITGGESTENEMFILIGQYYVVN